MVYNDRERDDVEPAFFNEVVKFMLKEVSLHDATHYNKFTDYGENGHIKNIMKKPFELSVNETFVVCPVIDEDTFQLFFDMTFDDRDHNTSYIEPEFQNT